MFAADHPPFATTSYSARGSPAFSLALSLLLELFAQDA
jgi:hypothetical protein